MNIFLDSDVIMDFLQKRSGHQSVAELFHLAEAQKISLLTSPIVWANVFYLVSKELGRKQALSRIQALTKIISTAEVGQKEVKKALFSEIKDFEDGLQYFVALRANVTMILTRNKKDYPLEPLPVLMPSEALTLIQANRLRS